jgi:lambda family phage portal protein
MMELPTGVDVNLLDPNHPVSAYADYVSGVLKGIAAGLGVTYHALSGDLTQVNFSSIRAGTIEERDRWKAVQQWLISKLHTPVFERWLQQNAASLGLSQGEVDRIEISWQPRGWTWVDPVKDLQAHQLAYQLGVTSLSEIAGASGRDLEEVFDQRAKEKALAEEYGVEINQITTEVIPDEEN